MIVYLVEHRLVGKLESVRVFSSLENADNHIRNRELSGIFPEYDYRVTSEEVDGRERPVMVNRPEN